jgi:hypothetical protein
MSLIIAAALALSASELPGTALPPIKEPGWAAWKIAGSAGPNELERLEQIRRKAMGVPSDKGNLWFRRWTGVIKVVRRR